MRIESPPSQTNLTATRPDGTVALEATYTGAILAVNFPDSGRRYSYEDVPRSTWEGMLKAADPALYLLNNVKGYYRYRRID